MEMNIEEAVGVVLPAILAFLQLIYQGGVGFNTHTISIYVSISLISVSASIPLPPCKFLKISISSLILACASILSCSVPQKLVWLPYVSCIRVFFHLLPDPVQHQFLGFIWNKADQLLNRLGISDANPFASAPANLNMEGVILEEVIPPDAHTPSPSTSTPTQLQLGSVSEATSTTIE